MEKKKTDGQAPVVRLRFEPGFADPNVCLRGHVILVLSGVFELGLAAGEPPLRLAAGEAVVVPPGTPHRAKNPGPEATELFVVSEPLWAESTPKSD